MKKNDVNAFVSLPVLILMFAITHGCAFSQKIETIDKVNSPDGKYEISIWRQRNRGIEYVSLTTKSDLKDFSLRNPLYYERDYDGDLHTVFEKSFPNRYWLNSKVFWMGTQEDLKNSKNYIVVENKSFLNIRQILLVAGSFYVINGVDSNETIRIPINWLDQQQRKHIGISVSVDFSDEKYLPVQAGVFPFPERSVDGNFEITITDKNVVVKSIGNPYA